MELIYRTFDGKEFDNEADAAYHENCIKDGLMMWDRLGNPTDKISDAFIVYFKNANAAAYFDVLAKEQCLMPPLVSVFMYGMNGMLNIATLKPILLRCCLLLISQ